MDSKQEQPDRPQSITDLCARTGDAWTCAAAAFVNGTATEQAATDNINSTQQTNNTEFTE
jgi:hypothetical protein